MLETIFVINFMGMIVLPVIAAIYFSRTFKMSWKFFFAGGLTFIGVEAYLVEKMRKLGGEAAKWVFPSRRGKPDRICLFPKGRVVFVELKTEGKQPSKEQLYEFQRMEDMGHPVFVVDTKKGVDLLIKMFYEAGSHE